MLSVCFFTTLRLGISNEVLIIIFQFLHPKAVARTINAVHRAMLSHFVPHDLGFNHISPQDVINNHSSPLAHGLLTVKPNTVVLVFDSTYLNIQVCYVYFLTQY